MCLSHSNTILVAMAKGAKKSGAAAGAAKKKGSKKGSRKPKRSFKVYIYRALKQVSKDLTLSGKSMAILNSFVTDIFERVAAEAASVARIAKKRTLGSAEIQTAVRLLFPAELSKHTIGEATKAVAKLSS